MTQIEHFMPPRTTLIFCFDGAQLLDISGPAQVFTTANAEGADPAYDVRFVGTRAGEVVTASGLPILLDKPGNDLEPHTLIIAGGPGVGAVSGDENAIELLRRLAVRSTRICSICTGAHVLAATGHLSGRRAVTHWRTCSELADQYPDIKVETDPLFVEDGNVWTSAGVTAGIDLCLALVERDHNQAIAARVARRLVVYLRRTGGQNQFSEPLKAQLNSANSYGDLIEEIIANPQDDWTAERMAERSGQSLRSFHRNFYRKTGQSPGKTVEAIRCALARNLLQTTDLTTDQIALRSGFGATSTMRRALQRQFGVAPKFVR